MTRVNMEAGPSINDMESAQTARSAPPAPREGEFMKRKRRRRLDLKTQHGTARESARVYRELAEGRITPATAEVRSRVLRRHGEILSSLEQQAAIEALQTQLARLEAGSGAAQELPLLDHDGHRGGTV